MKELIPSAKVVGGAPPAITGSTPLGDDVTIVPTYEMYSPGQATLAAFLGGPVSGAWLLSRNYKRLRQPGHARAALIAGIVATIALLAVAYLVPENFPNAPFAIVGVVLVHHFAKHYQGSAFEDHQRTGGKRASSWKAVGVGSIGFAATIGVILAVVLGFHSLTAPPTVDLGQEHEVYYTGGATELEARALGNTLTEMGFFDANTPATIGLRVDGQGYAVLFTVQSSTFEDTDAKAFLRELAGTLSKQIFHDRPVEVWIVSPDDSRRVNLAID